MQLAYGLVVGLAVTSTFACTAQTAPMADESDQGGAGGHDDEGGSGGDEVLGGQGGGAPAVFTPPVPTLRLLTERQLGNALRDLLGPRATLPPDLNLVEDVGGLEAVAASHLALPARSVERIHELALTLAQAAVAPENRAALVPCQPANPTDETCLGTFVTSFGKRVFRRPLDEAQRTRLIAAGRAVWKVEADFWSGVEAATAAMLASPYFLYRVELGRDAADGGRTFDAWDTATRLSFLLWDTTPDSDLLGDAEAGRLNADAGLRKGVDRLLGSPRATATLRSLLAEGFHLTELDRVTRAPDRFPAFTSSLRAAMQAETLAVIEDVALTRDADVREIYDTRTTFVTDELARLYGLQALGQSTPTRTQLPDGPRVGVLGHASFLTLGAHATATSPTVRGKLIRENVLCQTVPSPPPGVSTELPPPSGKAVTMRERLAEHRATPACAACHALIDPLGLPYEAFDPIGAYRTDDAGKPIDPSGELEGTSFADAAELGALLRKRSEPGTCLALALLRNASGYVEGQGQEAAVAALLDRFADGGFRVRPFVEALVASPFFRRAGRLD